MHCVIHIILVTPYPGKDTCPPRVSRTPWIPNSDKPRPRNAHATRSSRCTSRFILAFSDGSFEFLGSVYEYANIHFRHCRRGSISVQIPHRAPRDLCRYCPTDLACNHSQPESSCVGCLSSASEAVHNAFEYAPKVSTIGSLLYWQP